MAAVIGRIVDDSLGTAVKGARVDLLWQSGVVLSVSTASTTTRSDGTFLIEVPASDEGDVLVALKVSTPGRPSYTVPDVRLVATKQSGAATVLPPWVNQGPSFPYAIVIRPDTLADAGYANASVTFRRTSGVRMIGAAGPVASVSGTTNLEGWLYIFRSVRADSGGTIIGDLIVHSTTKSDSIVFSQVAFPVSPLFETPFIIANFGVGSL